MPHEGVLKKIHKTAGTFWCILDSPETENLHNKQIHTQPVRYVVMKNGGGIVPGLESTRHCETKGFTTPGSLLETITTSTENGLYLDT